MPSVLSSRCAKIPAALLTRTSIARNCWRMSPASTRMDACEDRSESSNVGAGPVATPATSAWARAPRAPSRQTINTHAPVCASARAVANPTPLFAPVIKTTLPCMASCFRSARRGEHIDEIAVRVAKQHGPIAPRLGDRLQDKFTDDVLQTRPLFIDIVDLEIEDDRAIGPRRC